MIFRNQKLLEKQQNFSEFRKLLVLWGKAFWNGKTLRLFGMKK
jgi:hypothetical protein